MGSCEVKRSFFFLAFSPARASCGSLVFFLFALIFVFSFGVSVRARMCVCVCVCGSCIQVYGKVFELERKASFLAALKTRLIER